MDAVFVGQLIESMSEALGKLEKVVNNKKKKDEATKLKTLIIDLHRQINDSLLEKNV
jgi:hypothetical protein